MSLPFSTLCRKTINGENEFLLRSNFLYSIGFRPCYLLLPSFHTHPANKNLKKRHIVMYQNLSVVNYLRALTETFFSFAEPQDDQAAFVQATLQEQHDQPTPFASSHSNPRWRKY